MRFLPFILLLLTSLISPKVYAVGETKWHSAVITNEQGLSNSAINSIFRDSRGFMWFGTWDGLNRYDGKSIKTFYPDIYDDTAISNNIIRKMLEDDNGHLWVVTERGLNRYSHDKESFSSWFTEYPELSLREHSLKANIGDDGQIWVKAYGLGIFRHDPDKDGFEQIMIPCLEDHRMTAINDFMVYGKDLFLLDADSLYVIDHGLSQKKSSFSLENIYNKIVDVTIDHNWFFVYDDRPFLLLALREGGMLIIDFHSGEVHPVMPGNDAYRLTAFSVAANENHFWLGTDDGNVLMMFPDDGFAIQPVLDRLPELADKKVKIWSVLETPDDLLWIGTDGEGVFRSRMRPKPFFQIGRGEAADRQLNHQIVRAIYEDAAGNLWVGTRGNGLNFIPYGHGSTIYFNTSNGLTNNAVLALGKDHNGYLWIGHDGNGIDLLEPETGTFFHFPDDLEGAEHLDFGSVYDICVDAFGQVWLGTSGYGVIGLNIRKEGGRFVLHSYDHIHAKGQGQSLGSNVVYAIVEEIPNILWLGTRGAGVYRMNILTGTLENFGMQSADKPGLVDNDVLSLHMGADGFLWVGTSGGLNRININYAPYEIIHYTMRDGLPNNTIHAILEDRQGNIWSSTNKGLSKLESVQNIFTNFNSEDGLQGNEYTDGAADYGKFSGRFYFGGINGLDWFYPEEIKVSDRQPKLLFTGFRLYNQLVLPGDTTQILTKNINELDEIRLRHHQNFFTVEFTTLNFINPDKSRFQYKLENFNTDWVFTGNQREANFTNVPDGKYRLLVRATNEDGIWSDEVRAIAIIIKPPFWKTWPAFLLYTFVLGLIIYSIYIYQTNRIRRQQERAIEKLQQQKEKELNQYKLQFFTNLAHEFGTPLTLIFASAGSLLNPVQNPEESKSLIKTIYQNSKRMQKLIQELLEFRKIDTGRETVKPRKLELVQSLNNIVQVFSHFAQENELEIIFEPDEEEVWLLLDSGKLEKIMLNLLSNAIKFTSSGGIIRVVLKTSQDRVLIEVSDTGTGIAMDVLPYVFDSYYQRAPKTQKNTGHFQGIGIGLAYTKSLVELLNGQITVESESDRGSTFRVDLPLQKVEPEPGERPTGDVLSGTTLMKNLADEFVENKMANAGKSNVKPALWTTPKKYKILVAEDDPELSGLLLKLLSEQYDVSVVHNGKQALEVIGNKRIDLVVSDIVMPELDGLNLCKTIRSDPVTSHIPVILLTAKSEMENRIEGLEMGADSYIPKPFHPKHLFVRIERLLKMREQLTESFKANFGTSAYKLKQDYAPRDRELLQKCVSYIEANCSNENLDADKLAAHLAFSKPQLYRKIKALTGLTPHGLIKNFRLKKARQMIAEDQYAISDIIYMTGFNNRTYFYRSYKEAFGETPGELQKQ